jgi:excisionase family DNA binding protein
MTETTMKTNQIIFFSLSPEELKQTIKEVFREELNLKREKELLSFKEVCQFLGVHPSTLSKWKSQNLIPFKKMGKRIFFSKQEVIAALKESNYSKLKEL